MVALFPVGDGERWLRSLRGHADWRALRRRIEADRISRSRAGESEMVDADYLVNRASEPGSVPRHPLYLECADAIMSFRPEDQVHRIAPRPVMVVGIENDLMVPFDEVERMYARIGEPKEMLALPGISHDDLYEERRLSHVVAKVARFLRDTMPELRQTQD